MGRALSTGRRPCTWVSPNRVYIGGLYWDNGKENGNYRDYRGNMKVYIGDYNGIMENRMETTLI